ncbi:complement component C8 alpha chain [Pholidichthys leucotaenia]
MCVYSPSIIHCGWSTVQCHRSSPDQIQLFSDVVREYLSSIMGALVHLILAVLILQLWIGCSTAEDVTRKSWVTAEQRAAIRRARAAYKPTPIDCKMGAWSPWTPCNSCTDKTFSFRYLEKPSQFSGSKCSDTLWRRLKCPDATTQCLVPDYCGESFTCKESGRCISQSLLCNGELDCIDNSDEDNCETINQREDKCSTLLSIPGAERGTQGYNILSGDFMDHVLDPKYFGGSCEYVYNGEWRKYLYDAFCEDLHYNYEEKNYRKPHNYHYYRFVGGGRSEGSHDYYEDVASLLRATEKMTSGNAGVTVGVYHVEAGLEASVETKFLRNITQYKSQEYGFIRLFSKLQTAQFKMRTNQLMLSEDFYYALMELPEEYDFGRYSRLFNTFGTHYVTEGTMGGTLEYIVVTNKTSMAKSKSEAHSAVIEDIITQVKGGFTHTSTGLVAIKDPETYQKWGLSLKYNPMVIESEIMPIHEAVRLSTAADHVGTRLPNLRRALEEYLQQFDPCRCAPCKHNGIPLLSGSSCECICKSGYEGQACEETLRRDTKTDGSWSCWGAWSPCILGTKTRTRSCNNPPPEGGGAACLGSTTQTWNC